MFCRPMLPTTNRFRQNLLIGLFPLTHAHTQSLKPIPAVQSVSECLGCKSSLDDDLVVCANGNGVESWRWGLLSFKTVDVTSSV